MTFLKRVLGGLAVTTLLTVPVLAKVAADAARPGNFTWAGTTLVPLTPGGVTSVLFSGQGKHVISYSAECETAGDWVSIQVIVDGLVLAPTAGTNDIFCSDNNNNNNIDGGVTAHYSVATPKLALGTHHVQIQATVVGAGNGLLGDSALVVLR
jgi:hypothetical protein